MTDTTDKDTLYRTASFLALLTILYNIAEGLVSVWLGLADETFALFGFGLDSFIEVVSGVGVWHMVRRLRQNGGGATDPFERRALRITGGGFYLLAAGLAATGAVNLYQGHRPETTRWGVVVALVSIASMRLLIHYKERVGKQLSSAAILADAACTRTCLYLSVILLAASAGYELTGLGALDSLGVAGVAWFSLREGREAFRKARGLACSCGGKCGA